MDYSVKHFLPSIFLLLTLFYPLSAYPDGRESGTDNSSSDHDGKALFAENCLGCHNGTVPKAPGIQSMSFMMPNTLYRIISSGVMAPMTDHLDDKAKYKIVEHITGEPPSSESEDQPVKYCDTQTASFDFNAPPKVSGWGVTHGNTRAHTNADAGINRNNVVNLELKWAFGFPGAVRARSHPVVAGGLVFVGSQDGSVYALDRDSGCVFWRYQARAEVRTGIVISDWEPGNRDDNPVIYFGDYIGYIYAVDAQTGELVWSSSADNHPDATITGTPTLHDNRLYVPVTSLEVASAMRPGYECCTFRGSLVAYDALTGDRIWKTFSIENRPEAVGVNSAGAKIFAPSGAGIWNSPTIDVKRNQLYVGTGQNYSSPVTGTSDSVVAINMAYGSINWVFQAKKDAWNASCEMEDKTNCPDEAGDNSDVDFGASVILAQGEKGDEHLLAGQKSGDVWALDPDDGSVIWHRKVGRGGMLGGVHFGMAAVNGVLYVPINDEDVHLADDSQSSQWTGEKNPGLFALDIETGESIWEWKAVDMCEERPMCKPGHSAPVTVTPELVVAGSLDGYLRIHDAATGEVLWRYNTAREFVTPAGAEARGGAMSGGAAAFIDDGMLFINSGYSLIHHMPGNVLLAFDLDGE